MRLIEALWGFCRHGRNAPPQYCIRPSQVYLLCLLKMQWLWSENRRCFHSFHWVQSLKILFQELDQKLIIASLVFSPIRCAGYGAALSQQQWWLACISTQYVWPNMLTRLGSNRLPTMDAISRRRPECPCSLRFLLLYAQFSFWFAPCSSGARC